MRTKKQRKRSVAATRRTAGTYWLTPKAWSKPCSHCDAEHSAACRPRDWNYACTDCVKRPGIRAKKSKAWHDGGSRAGATVTVRFIDELLPDDAASHLDAIAKEIDES
jgi:hypothetical protein